MSQKILYLEPVGGIAGDMFLAAALDLGMPQQVLEAALSGLNFHGYALKVSSAQRHAISGTHVDVDLVAAPHDSHPHRAYTDIVKLLRNAQTLSERVKENALKVFQVIGEAEAHIHQVPLEEIHFHEVGAVDSIVDICGAAVVLEWLGYPEVYSAPPPLGSGVVHSAHGRIPVPAPATLEILKDVPVRFEGVGELTTPTGAALLKVFAKIQAPPTLVVERVGYGVGTKDFADRANVLRATLGRRAEAAPETLEVVEANLDDCSPQILGALIEKLLDEGAHDAYVVPATMKKGRPGHVLAALVLEERKEHIVQLMLSESTTLGVRSYPVERTILQRTFETVETPFGPVRMKLGFWQGKLLNAHPEFEDCRRLSEQQKVPLKHVVAHALATFYQKPPSQD